MEDIKSQKERIAIVSVVSNTVLLVLKLIVGVIIGSVSVISEGIHSGVDLVAAIIAFFAVKTSNLPPDDRHMYGHGKYENVSGTVEAVLIFVAAIWIIIEAIHKLLNPMPLDSVSWGIVVMGISAIVNLIVSNKLFKIGKKADSLALQADAWHLRTDVYTSAGVALGLILYTLGKIFWPQIDLTWIDPAIAMIVAAMIIKAAFDLTKESVQGLLDTSLPSEENQKVLAILNEFDSKYESYHDFKTRKAGADRFVEFHIVVDGDMTVKESHNLTNEIAFRIKEILPNTKIIIHVDHYDDRHLFKVESEII